MILAVVAAVLVQTTAMDGIWATESNRAVWVIQRGMARFVDAGERCCLVNQLTEAPSGDFVGPWIKLDAPPEPDRSAIGGYTLVDPPARTNAVRGFVSLRVEKRDSAGLPYHVVPSWRTSAEQTGIRLPALTFVCSTPAIRFAGDYRGNGVTLSLAPQRGGYAGTVSTDKRFLVREHDGVSTYGPSVKTYTVVDIDTGTDLGVIRVSWNPTASVVAQLRKGEAPASDRVFLTGFVGKDRRWVMLSR